MNVGRIIRVVGPVIDVEFPADAMPSIYNALTIKGTTEMGPIDLVLEVEQHLEGGIVRTVSMDSTDGVTRGMEVVDTGAPMQMPVGPETLGHIWNVVVELGLLATLYPDQPIEQLPATVQKVFVANVGLSFFWPFSFEYVHP